MSVSGGWGVAAAGGMGAEHGVGVALCLAQPHAQSQGGACSVPQQQRHRQVSQLHAATQP